MEYVGVSDAITCRTTLSLNCKTWFDCASSTMRELLFWVKQASELHKAYSMLTVHRLKQEVQNEQSHATIARLDNRSNANTNAYLAAWVGQCNRVEHCLNDYRPHGKVIQPHSRWKWYKLPVSQYVRRGRINWIDYGCSSTGTSYKITNWFGPSEFYDTQTFNMHHAECDRDYKGKWFCQFIWMQMQMQMRECKITTNILLTRNSFAVRPKA